MISAVKVPSKGLRWREEILGGQVLFEEATFNLKRMRKSFLGKKRGGKRRERALHAEQTACAQS